MPRPPVVLRILSVSSPGLFQHEDRLGGDVMERVSRCAARRLAHDPLFFLSRCILGVHVTGRVERRDLRRNRP